MTDSADPSGPGLAPRNGAIDCSDCRIQCLYKPFVELQNGHLTGMEVSAYLPCPQLDVQFGGDAETGGVAGMLQVDIDDSLLATVFRDVAAWQQQGLSGVRLAISLSMQQFRDPEIANKIGDALAAAKLEPGSVCVQLTENHLLENTLTAEAALRQIRELGLCLVLDRFGAGLASLSFLRRYPFDAVKIDRSLIQAIDTDAEVGATIKAIVSMTHSLGLCVQAAGVVTEVQCDFLRRSLCDEVQGQLYSVPWSPEQVAAQLKQPPQLPEHLLRFHKPKRTLLLVDDEPNILTAMKRLLRRDGYQMLQAGSGEEGLRLLADNDVDVIVSDQRMPNMTGVEFLRQAKDLRPETIRIVLSGYTDLQSVTDAINEGAIYKFLTKPWEDDLLRAHIDDAFKRKEMADENRRLQLKIQLANHEMAAANRRLQEAIDRQLARGAGDAAVLEIARKVLQWIPLAAIGLDDHGAIAFANPAAQDLFGPDFDLQGATATKMMAVVVAAVDASGSEQACVAPLNGSRYMVQSHMMESELGGRGRILILTSLQGGAYGEWEN